MTLPNELIEKVNIFKRKTMKIGTDNINFFLISNYGGVIAESEKQLPVLEYIKTFGDCCTTLIKQSSRFSTRM